MQHYQQRISSILQSLNKERYSDSFDITECKYKSIGYGQRNLVVDENPKDWEVFDCNNTWGGLDSHFCFKTIITLPEEFEGKEVVLQLNTGATDIWNTDNPQFMAYVDSKMICAMDMNHHEVYLTKKATMGKSYDFCLYAYSNSEKATNFLHLSVKVHQPKVEKLYYDIKVPFEAASLQREEELSSMKTLELLNNTINCLDLRVPGSTAFYESIKIADSYLQTEYYEKLCKGSEVTVHSIGHTHIDVAWKWPLRQTREKTIRSFSTVIDLMERYPEYKFMSSQPQLYQFVKEDCPELYEKIKEKVTQGRWEVEGAMWLEADCNLTSGESLVRQILYGKKFFQEEFQKGDNIVLWLPDVFGYSAALPQILLKSGIKYFMTTKIGWNEYNQIPNDTMLWQGIDGSEVLTYFITTKSYNPDADLTRTPTFNTTYNGLQNASQIMGTWQRYQNKNINQDVLTCYGYGDGGGGPTSGMLEENRRLELGIPGCPKTQQTFVKDFFEKLEKNLEGKKIPKWCGELYLEYHRGTYTSMARNKKYNRLCEFKNSDAEFFSIINTLKNTGMTYPVEELNHAWKLTMLNQFHDILPGTSIKEVYDDSKEQYEEVLSLDKSIIEKAQNNIISSISLPKKKNTKSALVFNSLSFTRSGLVEFESKDEAINLMASSLPFQKTAKNTILYLVGDVPSKGYRVYDLDQKSPITENKITVTKNELESPFYHVVFDEFGEIVSIFDKDAKRELVPKDQKANSLLVFEDRPYEYDAWNIDAFYEEKMWGITNLKEFKVIENGPLRTSIYLKRIFLNSVIEQTIIFYTHSKRIDFNTTIDWKESQLLLKAAFPLDLMTNKATYEIQYGNVERSTHRNTSWDQAKFEVCAHKWVDLSESGYGVALLNDSKYGYDVHESVMRITLIKSGIFPNPDADKEIHQFTYALYPHIGDFREGNVINEAYDLNCPMYVKIDDTLHSFKEDTYSLFSLNVPNVMADVVKKAENNQDIIVRMNEVYGKRTNTILNLTGVAVKEIWECDLLENKEKLLEIKDNKVCFEIKPYEIKTFRLNTISVIQTDRSLSWN